MEQQSDLTGATWTTIGQYVKAGGGCGSILFTRNSENHHYDLGGKVSVVSDTNSTVLSNNLYDTFKVTRYTQGNSSTPIHFSGAFSDNSGLALFSQPIISERNLVLAGGGDSLACGLCIAKCVFGHIISPSCLVDCFKPGGPCLGKGNGTGGGTGGGGTGGGGTGGGGTGSYPNCTAPNVPISVKCKNGELAGCYPLGWTGCCTKDNRPFIGKYEDGLKICFGISA